jgi:hypothetical protein
MVPPSPGRREEEGPSLGVRSASLTTKADDSHGGAAIGTAAAAQAEDTMNNERGPRNDVPDGETRVLTVPALSADSSNMAHDVEIGAGGPHSAPRAFGVEMQGNGDSIDNFSEIGVESVECCDLGIDVDTGEERSTKSKLGRTPRNARGRGGQSWTHLSGLSTSSWMMLGTNAVRRYARLLEPNYLSFKSLAVEVGARSLTILPLQLPTAGMARFPMPNLLCILFFRHRPWHSIGMSGLFIATRALVCRRNSGHTRGEEIGLSTSSGLGFCSSWPAQELSPIGPARSMARNSVMRSLPRFILWNTKPP